MKSILLYANNDDGLEARLQAALDLARAFSGHLTCLSVTPYESYILGDPFGGIYALPVMVDELRAAEEAHKARLEAYLAHEGVAWDWLHRDGNIAQLLIDEARLADIVVMSRREPEAGRGPDTGWPGNAVITHARTPVLSVPASTRGFDCKGPVMIAWNGSDEAAHALRHALPLLALACSVHVVIISDDNNSGMPPTEACRYLARHGIRSELREWPLGNGPVARTLLGAAASIDARAIVMGAYSRSRMMEAVLGGTTRALIEKAPVPLILAH